VQVPEVLAVMDGREFEVIIDVATWAQSPGPTVETVGAEAKLLAGALAWLAWAAAAAT
jgi:hypothetical protein